MGSAEGSEHQAKEANADLGVPRIARILDRDLSAWLVCLLRDDRKLGLRHRGAKAALRNLPAVKTRGSAVNWRSVRLGQELDIQRAAPFLPTGRSCADEVLDLTGWT